jgi:hypothetical protein
MFIRKTENNRPGCFGSEKKIDICYNFKTYIFRDFSKLIQKAMISCHAIVAFSNSLLHSEDEMTRFILTAFFVTSLFFLSCSGQSSNPIVSVEEEQNTITPVFLDYDSPSDRQLLGRWEMQFNPESNTIKVELSRDLLMHYNVSSLIPAPIIVVNSYDLSMGILDVDVTLTNPTGVEGRDLRLIIFTDQFGHTLLNSDSWTMLHDIPGGLPINPFKAYAKEEINRKFSGGADHTENFQIYAPSGNFNIHFAVDASFPLNCEEPYEIFGFSQGEILDFAGSSTLAQVSVLDWQSDVSEVYIYCPEITGEPLVPFSQATTEMWELELVNNTAAEAGYYTGYIVANSTNSGNLSLYDQVSIRILSSRPDYEWVKTWGSEDYDSAHRIAYDGAGYIYVAGEFTDLVDFDPGDGVDEHESGEESDVFLSKFDLEGNFIRCLTWGSDDLIDVSDVAVDSSGNVYVTGYFHGLVDFDPSPWPGVEEWESNGDDDAYFSKFDSDGNFQYARAWGGTKVEVPTYIAIDSNGDPYIYGYFRSHNVDFDPSPEHDIHSTHGDYDVFVTKFDSDGFHQWARTWGGTLHDTCGGIGFAESGNVVVSGEFHTSVDFGDGNPITSNGMYDSFVSAHTTDGDFIAARTWGGIESDFATTLHVGLFGDLIICGKFTDTVDFDPGVGVTERTADSDLNVYISKFDSDLEFIDVLTWPGTDDFSFGCLTDSYDDFYFFGCLRGTIDFDPGPGLFEISALSGSDMVICKINNNFEFNWAINWLGPFEECIAEIAFDSLHNIFACGSFINTFDFDPGDGIDEHTPSGHYDAYFMKLTQNK